MAPDTFMIEWRDGRWAGSKDSQGTLPGETPTNVPMGRERDPWSHLRPEQPAEGYSGPKTVEEFLEYVIDDSEYNRSDVVAVGVGTTHLVQGDKLQVAYLTPRGMEEATGEGELAKPYEGLRSALPSSINLVELDAANLGSLIQVIGADAQRTLINWGGPDKRDRVVAVYSKDITGLVYKQAE